MPSASRRLSTAIPSSAALSAAMLSGCGAPFWSDPPSAAAQRYLGNAPQIAGRQAKPLLFVSDPNDTDVHYFSFPRGIAKGAMGEMFLPEGLCTDGTHLWVPGAAANEIVEYGAASRRPIRALADSGELPNDCAYDPVSGNLAVANYDNFEGLHGNIVIYRNGRGRPISYTCGSSYNYISVAYDSAGNLFMDATSSFYGGFAFCELPKGSKLVTSVSLNQRINNPGGVRWDGRRVAVGDAYASVIYQFRISRRNGTKDGTTTLTALCGTFAIVSDTVICTDYKDATVSFYDYPAGGSPTSVLTGFKSPVGPVVVTDP